MSPAKIAAFLKKNNRFLITAHVNLEGDALGSELALFRLLRKLGKEAFIVNEDRDIPYGYDFLPDTAAVRVYKAGMNVPAFDAFLIVDCSDIRRSGEVYRLNSAGKPVVNIDHHVSNTLFGDLNLVDGAASSCAELIYRLYKACGVPLDKESALLLYVGIMTDSGSFRYSSTSAVTHKIAAELLAFGIDVSAVYKQIYGSVPYQDMKLLADILPTLHREAGGKVIWYALPHRKLAHKQFSFDLTEHILSFARSIKGVEVVALFKENLGVRDEVRINLRSQGSVDVNSIAKAFGGGGHKTASGATVHGKLEAVRRKALRAIKKAISASGK